VPGRARCVGSFYQPIVRLPLHTCGTVGSSSAAGQRNIAKSWNYTEFFPLNLGAVADYQAAHHALFGRYPSFAWLMKNARIKDQVLVFD